MPVYEYRCNDCALTVERLYPMDSFPLSLPCINCGERAYKIMSLPNAIGLYKAGWGFNEALGFTPTSSRQIDRFCKRRGWEYAGGGDIPKVAPKSRDLKDLTPGIMGELRK